MMHKIKDVMKRNWAWTFLMIISETAFGVTCLSPVPIWVTAVSGGLAGIAFSAAMTRSFPDAGLLERIAGLIVSVCFIGGAVMVGVGLAR